MYRLESFDTLESLFSKLGSSLVNYKSEKKPKTLLQRSFSNILDPYVKNKSFNYW